ncbi:MAG TPA: calcium-binding protein, partial [Burkholderiales bacterium]
MAIINGTNLNDTLNGTATDDQIFGLAGNDTISGDLGNDLIDGGAGDDFMDGELGVDTLSYASASAGVTVSLAIKTAQNTGGAGIDTFSNFENLIGSAFNDVLTGGGENNVIEGGAGNDIMDGAGGTDAASYAGASSAVTVDLAILTAQDTLGAGVDTLANFEDLIGSAFNDTLLGNIG